ncbi:hypothetical protein AB3N59_02725 [Leptospira sp. WS92.C1]
MEKLNSIQRKLWNRNTGIRFVSTLFCLIQISCSRMEETKEKILEFASLVNPDKLHINGPSEGRNQSSSIAIGFSSFNLNLQERTHGGNQTDIAHAIAVTPDGGAVLVGTSLSGQSLPGVCNPGACSTGKTDVYVSKYNSVGTREWSKLIGSSRDDVGSAVSVLNDGSILIAGSSVVNGPAGDTNDTYLIKLSAEGNVLWQRIYGDPAGWEQLFAVLPTEDGGLIAVGDSDSSTFPGNQPGQDVYVTRLNASGGIVWQQLLGGNGTDTGRGICKLGNDYYITGRTSSSDLPGTGSISNFYVAKLSSSGQILAQKRVGNINYNEARAISCIQGGPHGDSIVLVGKSTSTLNESSDDLMVVQLSPTLDVIWTKVIGGKGPDFGTGIIRDPLNPNFVFISGETSGNYFLPYQGGSSDGFVIRLDLAQGKTRWFSGLGGSAFDSLNAIAARSDGYIYTAGKTQSSDIENSNQGSTDVYLAGFQPPPPFTDSVAPYLNGTVQAESLGCGKVGLEWSHVNWFSETNEAGLSHYKIDVNGASRVTQGTPQRQYSNKRNYVVSGLEPGSTHNFWIYAVDRAGNESTPLVKTFQLPASNSSTCTDTISPTMPSVGLIVDNFYACNRSIQLAISGSTDSGSPTSGILEYRIYRNEIGPTRLTPSTTGSITYYQDYIGKLPGKGYAYRVETVDRAGNVSSSKTVSHSLPSTCGTPTIPKQLHLAVIPVTPNNAPAPVVSRAQIEQMVMGSSGEFASFGFKQYLDEVSYGTYKFDPIYIAPDYIRLPEPILKSGNIGYCNRIIPETGAGVDCDTGKIFNHAIAQGGLNESDYDHFLIVSNAMHTGVNSINKSHIHTALGLKNTYETGIHELMHGIGGTTLHTSGSWHCPGMPATLTRPPSPISMSTSGVGANPDDPLFGCENSIGEYDDYYSALGIFGGTYHIPAYLKMLKGFLRSEQTIMAPFEGQPGIFTVTLEALETKTSGIKQILIPIGRKNSDTHNGSVLSLEYRTIRGFNADPVGPSPWPATQGIQIRLIPRSDSIPQDGTETIFMGTIVTNNGTPQTFYYGDIRIEVLQSSFDSVQIRIRKR